MNTRRPQPSILLSLLLAGAILLTAGCGAKKVQPSPAVDTPPVQNTQTAPSTPQPTRRGCRDRSLGLYATGRERSGHIGASCSSSDTHGSPHPLAKSNATVHARATAHARAVTLADWPALSLTDWPRPANDNGLCMHNIGEQYYDEQNLSLQISRLKEMNIRWTVLLYGDENMLKIAAPMFRDAGITVIWRKMLRAYERYYDWGRDIQVLRELGVEPYMQLYNEPSLSAEWNERHRPGALHGELHQRGSAGLQRRRLRRRPDGRRRLARPSARRDQASRRRESLSAGCF